MTHRLCEEVQKLLASQALKLWKPMEESDGTERLLYVSAEVDNEFDGTCWIDDDMARRYAILGVDFDTFVSGAMISVGMEPYDKSDNAFLARIDPIEYGMWTIRSRAPKPAIRVFGAFLDKDVFVAVQTRRRNDLGGRGSREWRNARENSIAKWRDLFPNHTPILGDNVHDFLTQKALAV
jgi:hypothetical protein